MGLPSGLFIVRHGARRDQESPKWLLSSPTPYDPPLSLRGVDQSLSCGQTIHSLIEQHCSTGINDHQNINASIPFTKPDLKTQVIILSSPFLRCVQTAGCIAETLVQHSAASDQTFLKPIVRIDSWLGEWLTPDYYADIPPPPPMHEMATSLKARLMNRSSTPPELLSLLENALFDWTWDDCQFGKGGEYGEEWIAMHRRCRDSLNLVLQFFSNSDAAERISSASPRIGSSSDNEDPIRTVLVIVTHGAPCNALIGAVTSHPVLVDIDVASISMAILVSDWSKVLQVGKNLRRQSSSSSGDDLVRDRISKKKSRNPYANPQATDGEYRLKGSIASTCYKLILQSSTSHLARNTKSNAPPPLLESSRRSFSNLSLSSTTSSSTNNPSLALPRYSAQPTPISPDVTFSQSMLGYSMRGNQVRPSSVKSVKSDDLNVSTSARNPSSSSSSSPVFKRTNSFLWDGNGGSREDNNMGISLSQRERRSSSGQTGAIPQLWSPAALDFMVDEDSVDGTGSDILYINGRKGSSSKATFASLPTNSTPFQFRLESTDQLRRCESQL